MMKLSPSGSAGVSMALMQQEDDGNL